VLSVVKLILASVRHVFTLALARYCCGTPWGLAPLWQVKDPAGVSPLRGWHVRRSDAVSLLQHLLIAPQIRCYFGN
jgi:hypothetical protein